MSVLFSAVLPVTLIILIGFISDKTLSLERQTLSSIILYILSPALIFDNLYRTTLSGKSIVLLLIGLAITTYLLYLAALCTGKILKLSVPLQKSLIITTIFPNSGNMGLPFVDFALGAAGLERGVIYMIGMAILLYCIGPALLEEKGMMAGMRLILKLPFLWAVLAGSSLRLLSWQIPFNLGASIHKLGEAAIPLALIILGIQLNHTHFKLEFKEFLGVALRLILGPLIAYFVSQIFGLDDISMQVLVLQSSMPTAICTFVLATKFGGDIAWIARTVVVSTLMSFLTLPIVFWFIVEH